VCQRRQRWVLAVILTRQNGNWRIATVIPKSHALFTITIPAYAFPTLPHAPSSLHAPTPTFNADAFARTLREVPKIEVDILGSAFRFRAEDRAGRKFKVGSGATGWGQEWVGLEALGLDL
jgi:ribonuclease P protein subunit POP4